MTLSLRAPRTIDELLNYRLTRVVNQGGAPVVRLLEGRHGISRREWRLLALLDAHGAMAPSALAEVAQLDRPRTSRALGALAAKGLVRRDAVAGDARRALVRLSAAGAALHAEVFPQVAVLNAQLVDVLDDAEVAALDRMLVRLSDRARQLNQTAQRDVQADRRAGGSRRVRPDARQAR